MMRFFAALVCAIVCMPMQFVAAQESVVIATVNDVPITTFDVEQRIRLLEIIGQGGANSDRKKIANTLIDDVVKIAEAKRNRMDATEGELDDRLKRMATGMKTDQAGLSGKLKKQGVSMVALRNYVAAQMAFGRLLSSKYKEKVELDPAAVDQKMADIKAEINGKIAKVMADPRMQPITVYTILEVNFPVEGNDAQLLQSRAIEAGQYLQRFKSCNGAKAAASGIFNVKVGKKIEADGKRLPKQLKALFDSKGPGNAYGPMRSQNGIQVVAFCGTRKIVPPKPKAELPSRQQIENAVLNERYGAVEQKYVRIMRKNAVIEYKDQSYAQ